jgi:hypothetical protein
VAVRRERSGAGLCGVRAPPRVAGLNGQNFFLDKRN